MKISDKFRTFPGLLGWIIPIVCFILLIIDRTPGRFKIYYSVLITVIFLDIVLSIIFAVIDKGNRPSGFR